MDKDSINQVIDGGLLPSARIAEGLSPGSGHQLRPARPG